MGLVLCIYSTFIYNGGKYKESFYKSSTTFFTFQKKARKGLSYSDFQTRGKTSGFRLRVRNKLQESSDNSDVKSLIAAPVQTRPRPLPRCIYCKLEGYLAAHCSLHGKAIQSQTPDRDGRNSYKVRKQY